MRIGLVGCTKSKLDHRALARDLYSPSALFRGRRAYVEKTCDRWFILSAKHGLVDPDRELDPYDVTLKDSPVGTKRAWTERILQQMKSELGDLRTHDYEIHAGRDYWGYGLVQQLQRLGATVEIPSAGLGVGEQLHFYQQAVRPQRPTEDEVEQRRRHDDSRIVRRRPPENTKGSSAMSSYSGLKTWLQARPGPHESLSFAQIEQILGRKLPPSAHDHGAWWGNHVGTHSHARSWIDAGWEVDEVNLTARRVAFRKV